MDWRMIWTNSPRNYANNLMNHRAKCTENVADSTRVQFRRAFLDTDTVRRSHPCDCSTILRQFQNARKLFLSNNVKSYATSVKGSCFANVYFQSQLPLKTGDGFGISPQPWAPRASRKRRLKGGNGPLPIGAKRGQSQNGIDAFGWDEGRHEIKVKVFSLRWNN
jgi:hypothetical protein